MKNKTINEVDVSFYQRKIKQSLMLMVIFPESLSVTGSLI